MFAYLFLIVLILVEGNYTFLVSGRSIKTLQLKKDYIYKLSYWHIFSVIFILILSTFKNFSVGCDTFGYLNFFNNVANIDILKKGFEPGFNIVCYVFAKTGLGFRGLIFFISLFVNLVIVWFVNRRSDCPTWSLLLYVALGVFAQSLSALRQIIAIAFMLIAVDLLLDKKIWKSLIFVIIASLFHKSALITLVIYPAFFVKLKHYHFVILFICAMIVSLLLPYIAKLLASMGINNYITHYLIKAPVHIQKSSIVRILYAFGLLLIFGVYYYIFSHPRNSGRERYEKFYITLYFLVPVVHFSGCVINAQALMNRLSMYFFVFLIIIIPNTLKYLNAKLKTPYVFSTIIISSIYMLILYIIKNICTVYPYQFCF